MKSILFIAILMLFSACSTTRKTIRESVNTQTSTIYKDTTVFVHLPREAPQSFSQQLFTKPELNLNDSLFNTDTLVIEHYYIKAKAFVNQNKLYLQTEPKDTAIKVNLKNAIRETHTQIDKQKIIEKQKNEPVILWVILLVAVLLMIGFFGKNHS